MDILEDPERIINTDESGFQTSPSSGLVLGPRGFKNFYEIKKKEKEYITVLGTFSASRRILPLLIILYIYNTHMSESHQRLLGWLMTNGASVSLIRDG